MKCAIKRVKAFTVLELIVVVAILSILAIVAVPNFINSIQKSKDARELAEINSVSKAISMYYADNGQYPTLQGKDGSMHQVQPILGSPHNIDFSALYPTYLANLPHFSYWYIDYEGHVFHDKESLGIISSSGLLTLNSKLTYEVHAVDKSIITNPGTTVDLSTGEYVIPIDGDKRLPMINKEFKGVIEHPESLAASGGVKPIVTIKMTPSDCITNTTDITWGYELSADTASKCSIVQTEWKIDGAVVPSDTINGKLSVGNHKTELRVKDKSGMWSDTTSVSFSVVQDPNISKLVCSLSLDETTGNIAYDSSSNKINGTYYGAASIDGFIGKARHFQNVADRIDFNSGVIPGGPKSIKFRIRTSTIPSGWVQMLFDGNAIGKYGGSCMMIYNGSGKIGWRFSSGNWNCQDTVSTTNICDGKWHTIAYTWDGTYVAGGCKLYVDDMTTPNAVGANTLGNYGQSYNLRIGYTWDYMPDKYQFTGDLDDIKIYSGVIDPRY